MRPVLLIVFAGFLSSDAFAELKFKGGGSLAIVRAEDAHANLGGYYFGVEYGWLKEKYGVDFRIRKEGRKIRGPDNGLYFSFAGMYKWQPELAAKIKKDTELKFHLGYEFGLAHVDYNAFTEEETRNRWTYICQNGNLIVRYPFVGISALIPLEKSFYKAKDIAVEVGTQLNFPQFGLKESVMTQPGIYEQTKDERGMKIVHLFYVGINFHF